ncbi:hypothetical protein JCGZ_17132 [Jatropha curcas]|uniref:Uncharacterized protein n=1 Tax=Jatropha curcas TaxID=180498 RepID=A0A067K302_JATCU|nr:hypothetical protein JCGZ_17132 [Jatropha curcas]
MARGRAVDSNVSDSGPREGRGRGSSTRGQRVTISLPSSGTSRASSSAQPPVSPPLPSIPSSSTRPVESSPASQSPIAPASSEPRNNLSLVARQSILYGKGYYGYAKSGLGEIVSSTDAKKQKKAAVRVSGDMGGLAEGLGRSCIQDKAEKYVCEPTPMGVFTYTHTKDHDENTFVDRRALGVNPDYSAEEISALRAHIDVQERQLAKLRAHVMRMFGHHGAGTSSYDPPSVIDPHVSTALHQPLSSPLDPDTTDTTTHPAADTTINPVDTTLDCLEDRHHRFDFRPF